MSKSVSGKALLILGMTGALGVGALAYYVKMEPGAAKVPSSLLAPHADSSEPTRAPRSSRKHYDELAEDTGDKTTVSLPRIKGSDVQLSKSMIVPAGKDPMVLVAEACLREANVADSKVLSVDSNNRVVVVNFDRTIDQGMGSEQEGTFLKSLQLAFGQFSNIDRIEIDREGSPVSTLGNIELDGPLPVTRSGDSSSHSSKPIEP